MVSITGVIISVIKTGSRRSKSLKMMCTFFIHTNYKLHICPTTTTKKVDSR